jgi:maltose alpha-D-glucosyltransferase/alpha-amylase
MMRHTPKWLKDAVFYEIYPQSFYDSNGDGIGDIQGIIKKLDYIKSLGVDAVWLNPCFMSPFQDAGYDISDYYKTAPRYGTNADLKKLFIEAKKKGIRIILDFVPGHTSIEHPWFKKSAEPVRNKYSNWYIWTNNWWDDTDGQNFVGGYSDRNGKYITNFFWFQPALNFGFAKPNPKCPWQLPVDHPDVKALKEELKNVLRFWLNMGASGFRVDMAASLIKNDPDNKECIKFWSNVRDMMEKEYPESILVSEWGNPKRSIKAGFHTDFLLHFNIPVLRTLLTGPEYEGSADYSKSYFNKNGKGDCFEYMKIFNDFYKNTKGKGYVSLITGNHDIERLNYNRTDGEMEIIFAYLLTMPGVPFIYYGEEIGLRQIQPMRSKENGYNRTSARTPMQWTPGKNAGFSKAEPKKLYLPVDPDKNRPCVEIQENIPNSLLKRVRSLIKTRKNNSGLGSDGNFKLLYCKSRTYPLIYARWDKNTKYIIALNPSGKKVKVRFKTELTNKPGIMIKGHGVEARLIGSSYEFKMNPVSYGIYRMAI